MHDVPTETAPQLRRFLILFEPEAACRDRLVARGMAPEVAAEIAFYLAQATDFQLLVEPVTAAFAATGVEVVCLPLDPPEAWLPLLTGPDRLRTLVWCLTDGFAWYRGSFVSSVAALLGVPQFGSPPAAQHLCQDKFRCLALAQALGVRTPPTVLVEDGRPLSPVDVLPAGRPLFVKPNTLGAKLGIEADSRVADLDAALALTRRIHARYGDRALIQAYVPGPRRAGQLHGSGRPGAGARPLRDRHRRRLPDPGRFPAHDHAQGCRPRCRPDRRHPQPRARPRSAGARPRRRSTIAHAIGLRDYFSFDFRLDADGQPWFLEFEVCPAVTIYDFLTYLRDAHGTDLIGALLQAAPLAFARRLAGS